MHVLVIVLVVSMYIEVHGSANVFPRVGYTLEFVGCAAAVAAVAAALAAELDRCFTKEYAAI